MGKKKIYYYSQHGEDFLLWHLFGFKDAGYYIDVGAFDGIHLSNSYSFEQQGWKGICIEANPDYFKACESLRPGAICLNVACVADGSIETVEFFAEELGLLSGLEGNREEDVRSRYETRGLEFKGFKKIITKASTLNRIISDFVPDGKEIDFISIDVEGTEIDVLKGIDLNKYRPRVLLIEANSKEAEDVINDYMVRLNSYFIARKTGPNIFYVRSATDVDRLASIKLDCRIEKNLHPLGEKYTIKDHIAGKIVTEGGDQQKQPSHFKGMLERLRSKFRA